MDQYISQEETRRIISDMVKFRIPLVILYNIEVDSLCILGRAKRPLDLWSLVPKGAKESSTQSRIVGAFKNKRIVNSII